jgi:flagella basal body P-ring formation protein FlgA
VLVTACCAAQRVWCQTSCEQAVVQAISQYVERARHLSGEEIHVTCGSIPSGLAAAVATAESLRVRPANGEAELRGKKLFNVEALRNGMVCGRGHVLATVRVFAEVVVARRRLDRKEVLSVADLALERRELTNLHTTPVRVLREALGKRTRRMIATGHILSSEDIERPPVVKQGEVVNMVVGTKNLSVTMKVTALQDGALGERIAVRAEGATGRKRYLAEVKEPGLVVLKP